jgi:hypothetical protein
VLSVLLMVGICAVCYVLASWLWWEAVKTPTVSVFTSLALMKASMMTDTGSRMKMQQRTVSTHHCNSLTSESPTTSVQRYNEDASVSNTHLATARWAQNDDRPWPLHDHNG